MKKLVKKNNLYLIVIGLLALLILISTFIFLKKSSYLKTSENDKLTVNPKAELVFDANEYKNSARDLFTRLSTVDPSIASELKQKLLAMKVSKEFKDVHFSLVMVSVSLEDYSLSRNEESLNKAKTILAKLKKDYAWLTDKSL